MTAKPLQPGSNKIYFFFLLLIVSTGISVFLLNQVIIQREVEKRQSQLENINGAAKSRFESSLVQFATIASAMRSYIHQEEGVPKAKEFQKFINNLLQDLDFESPYVVSLIDTTHNFIYVFDRNQVDPNFLAGNPIPQSGNPEIINRLDSIMLTRSLNLSKPINLLEGWIGIAYSFGVFKNGSPAGYVTPSFSVEKILNDIYDEKIADDFVFKFIDASGKEFDRSAIYDGTPIYTNKTDSLNHNNYSIPEERYIYSTLEMYGQKITIGTAHKTEFSYFNIITLSITLGFILFILAFWYISQQTIKLEKLNQDLSSAQEVMNEQKKNLEIQNQELKNLNSTKDRFFSVIGHDVKSPLSSIAMMIDLKENGKIAPDEEKEFFANIKNTTHRTLALLENLLKWATLNSQKVQVSKSKVDVSSCLNEAVKLAEQSYESKEIHLDLEIEDKLFIHADYNMVSSSVRNLLSNAIKFTHAKGNISIKAEKANNLIRIQFKDDGIGLSDEEKASIFDIDKSIRNQGTQGEAGSGLGLVLTKEFVERNDGHMEVEGEKNNGSIFTLYFPQYLDQI